MSEIENLQTIRNEAMERVKAAGSVAELDGVDTAFLGRKGELTLQLRKIGSLPADQKKDFGQAVNDIKAEITEAIEMRKAELAGVELASRLENERLDVTMPGRMFRHGRSHILVDTFERIKEIFVGLGYEMFESPEVELYANNFEALNYPEEHPALDEQMSFYINDKVLMRTHTTAYQRRVMLDREAPLRVATIGKCYRSDAVDATHGHTFHQVDCFTIDRGISMSDLKGTIHEFASQMFGGRADVRFRPDFFPFVEPGAEFAVTCIICGGEGCNVCKKTGWLEIGGAGMIHENILRNMGFDPEVYSGFAFGFGIERMPMLRQKIGDLRLFMENDLRFLRQL